MNIFHITISALVFGSTLMLGTTAVIASRFVITTVAGVTKPAPEPRSVVMSAAEPERVVDLPDLRNEPPSALDDFDPTGVYSLDKEKTPPAFADIESISISTRADLLDENDRIYTSMPIVPDGSVETSSSFEFTKVAVNHREISFETETQNGISYQFVGDFPISPEFVRCEYPADLEGHLKKLKNRKVIAEMEAKFYYNGC